LKQHREKYEEREEVSIFKRFSRYRVRIQHCKKYAKECTYNACKNCNTVGPEQFTQITKQILISIKTNFAWEKRVPVGYK